MPFVADDLLLNLDNKRAQAALRTLAAIAASSQVLLFTHHAHMVDLARIAVPPPILIEHNLLPATSEAGDRRTRGYNRAPCFAAASPRGDPGPRTSSTRGAKCSRPRPA